ncbi:protein of unknown function [uncultured Sphingopyxis sp.]|uniref:Uncharacterized protein n=1 Tax=uncultured Sphingopyxis sp. TaxID=310581 RepID=A0A1Y5PXH6_9SPHN|nr:protein of unknown function [uncultured Sphingopyxis sp.]
MSSPPEQAARDRAMAHRAPARSGGLLSSMGLISFQVGTGEDWRLFSRLPPRWQAPWARCDNLRHFFRRRANGSLQPESCHTNRIVVIQFLLDSNSLFPASFVTPVTKAGQRNRNMGCATGRAAILWENGGARATSPARVGGWIWLFRQNGALGPWRSSRAARRWRCWR